MRDKTQDWQAEATVLFDTGIGQGLDDANDLYFARVVVGNRQPYIESQIKGLLGRAR